MAVNGEKNMPSINYLALVTDEQYIEFVKHMDEWWSRQPWQVKQEIMRLVDMARKEPEENNANEN